MSETLDVQLLGKDYRIACPAEERESLELAVERLREHLDAMQKKTRGSGERLVMMVALELAHELILGQRVSDGSPVDSERLRRSIKAIESRIAAALGSNESLF